MKYKIVSDSGANLHKLEEIDFVTVPLNIITDEKQFLDDSQLNVQEMVDFLSTYKGKSGSSCPSVAAYYEAYGDADIVFCFTITGNLSGSYNAARLAKEDYESEHPGRKVCVVDTLSAGPEMKILIERVEEMMKAETDFEAMCEEIMEYKEHTGLVFSLESMNNLANNGRVSPVVAKFAGLLGIRVVGRASLEGTLEPLDKCRGEKKAILKLLSRMEEMGYAGGKVRIDHCDNIGAAEDLKAVVLDKYPDADVQIDVCYGLCSFYAEKGGMLIGFEKK